MAVVLSSPDRWSRFRDHTTAEKIEMALKRRILAALGMLCLLAASASSLAQDRATTGFPEKPAEIDTRTWSALKTSITQEIGQQAKLTPPGSERGDDGRAGDGFGWTVALSGDTALVGVPFDSLRYPYAGSAYVFVRTGPNWSLQAKLVATDHTQSRFGTAVALDGETAVIGAPEADVDANTDQGAVYVFIRAGVNWGQHAKLTSADGDSGDNFGSAVSISGQTILVGAHRNNIGSVVDQGAAYAFVKSGALWLQQGQLIANDGAIGDEFGKSVAIDGDTAIVGASEDSTGTISWHGSAYIYIRTGANWSQQAKLRPIDALALARFGQSVALSGETAIIGAAANRSAYVYVRGGSSWSQQAKLVASDSATANGFGNSVDIEGDVAVVGAGGADATGGTAQGAGYVFSRVGTLWSQRARLVAGDGAANDGMGSAIALSGNSILIGARADDIGLNAGQGSAYVFRLNGAAWSEEAKLAAGMGGHPGAGRFGFSVALYGDTALVGTPYEDVGGNDSQGTAYAFVRTGSAWELQATLVASDGGTLFGRSVSLFDQTALIGASDSAYVFVRTGATWSQQAKLSPSGQVGDFGVGVSIDNDTALIGASGSAYVFLRSGTSWTWQSTLLANNGSGSVAIKGETAVVGAKWDDIGANTNQGSAYVFVRNGASWSQQAKLLGDAGVQDLFGGAVAIFGDTVLIGSSGDSPGGSAYVFTRSGILWSREARLTDFDGASGDGFGSSVALVANLALIGANGDDVGGVNSQGSALVFERVGVSWSRVEKLTAPTGSSGATLGFSGAIYGDTFLVGAANDFPFPFGDFGDGAVYVFRQFDFQDAVSVAIASHLPEPSVVNNEVVISVAVAGTTTTPIGGQVTITTSTGEGCVDATPTAGTGLASEFSCSITFNSAGTRSLVAEFSGSTTHQSAASPSVSHAVQPLPSVSVSDASTLEGTGGTVGLQFTLTRTHALNPVTVLLSTSDMTATAAADYVPVSSRSVNFVGNSPTASIIIVINGDGVLEADESFQVGVSGSTGATISDPIAVGTILNDDSASIAISNNVVTEGNSGLTSANFNVTLSGGVQGGFTVPVSSANGTAIAGSDFNPIAPGAAIVFSGAPSESVPVVVSVTGDIVLEGNETFSVNLGIPSASGVSVSTASGTGTINNDDNASLSIQNVSLTEGNSGTIGAEFSIALNGAVQGGFSVPVATASGSATAGSDFVSLSPGVNLGFVGAAGETRSVTVSVIGDTIVEANEFYQVVLGTPSNSAISIPNPEGMGTINNDDSATVSFVDVIQAEGDSGSSTFTFTVALAGNVQGGFTVPYQTTNGTAQAGSDYTSAAGTLSFTGTNGQTRAIAVAVTGELMPELDETFHVDLSAPSLAGVTVSPNRRTGTILNDDLYADISVSNSNGTSSLQPGQVTVYAVEIANNSAVIDVPAVQVVQSLPAALINITWTCSGSGAASCPASSGIGPLAATVGLPRGGSLSYLVSATVDGTAVAATVDAVVSASVLAPYADQNMGNNSATDSDVLLGNEIFGNGFE